MVLIVTVGWIDIVHSVVLSIGKLAGQQLLFADSIELFLLLHELDFRSGKRARLHLSAKTTLLAEVKLRQFAAKALDMFSNFFASLMGLH